MMPLPRKIAIALFGAGAVALAAWYFHTPRRPVRPIDAVPPDAFVAIDINVGALRRSGALTALFGDRDEQKLTEVCGFDPVDQMEDLVFTVPEDGNGDFGVAVQAALTQDQLVGCANQIVKAHGGDPTADIVTRGSYNVITPRSTSAESTRPPRSLGYSRGSPILVGPRSWLYTMIDAIDDASEGKSSPGEHANLRTRLAASIKPPPTFLVTGTALLDRRVREKLKAEMVKEVGTARDTGTLMMFGVLGMSSAVIGLYEGGDDVHAVAHLHCEEEQECVQVGKLIAKVRDEWAKMPALREFGLGPVLDHLKVDHHGTQLEVEAVAPTADVVRWAKLFLESRPLVARPDASGSAPSAASPQASATGAGTADVPTQTIHVQVPEGVAPGQPFTVRIPSPVPGASGGVRVLSATAVPPSPAPPPSAAATSSPAPHPP